MTVEQTSTPPQTTVGSAPFRDLCALSDESDGTYGAVIDQVWTIGKKVHGGAMLAICAAAARRRIREGDGEEVLLQPIAVSVDYLGAPEPGAVTLTVNVRKRGRQICLADVELSQNGRTAVRAAVTLGQLDLEAPLHQLDALTDMPAEPPVDALRYDGDSPLGKIVNVAKGIELRLDPTAAKFVTGEIGEPVLQLWARPFPGDENDPDVALLFAMMVGDISPPVVFNRGMFGWAPTVQLTTYLQRVPAPGWLRVISSSKSIGAKVFDEDHLIIDSTGAVVVQSRQLALIGRGAR
jgi:hypothetical protein